jgi:hypothetical protein
MPADAASARAVVTAAMPGLVARLSPAFGLCGEHGGSNGVVSGKVFGGGTHWGGGFGW